MQQVSAQFADVEDAGRARVVHVFPEIARGEFSCQAECSRGAGRVTEAGEEAGSVEEGERGIRAHWEVFLGM
jgi:hypothetical protein